MSKQKLVVDGLQIREQKDAGGLFQFRNTRRVARCDSTEWAEKLTTLYNQSIGINDVRPESNISETVATDYFDTLVAGGMSEKKAAVLTLRYLCGFFSEHIQYDNLKKVLETVERNFKPSKIEDK